MEQDITEIKETLYRLVLETEDVKILEKVQNYFKELVSKKFDY